MYIFFKLSEWICYCSYPISFEYMLSALHSRLEKSGVFCTNPRGTPNHFISLFWFRRCIDHAKVLHQSESTCDSFFNRLLIKAKGFASFVNNYMFAFSCSFFSQRIGTKRCINSKRRTKSLSKLHVLRIFQDGAYVGVICAHSATGMKLDSIINKGNDFM